MLTIRVAETDADLDGWRRVRATISPDERSPAVEELRAATERLYLLAELDGDVVGSGSLGPSDTGGAAVFPRVLPPFRRRGIGMRLLRRLADEATTRGAATAGCVVDDARSLAFAARFGFVETGRQVEQVYTVRGDEAQPQPPAGIEFVRVAERPEMQVRAFRELALAAVADMPTVSPIELTEDLWLSEWFTWPEASFVALAGGEIVGCAGLVRDADRPERAEHALTAVRADWRGRGVAKALKRQTIAWAACQGLEELFTWTQDRNDSMQAVNRSLGYVDRHVCVNVRRSLPLLEESR